MRVFTYGEIARGLIPQREDFDKLAATVRQIIPACPTTIGAVILGSVNDGLQNEFSDMDVYWLTEDSDLSITIDTSTKLYQAARDLHIPLQLVLLHRRQAANGTHAIRYGFRKHLEYAADHGGLVCGEPFGILEPHPVPHFKEVREYLGHKLKGRKGSVGEAPTLGHQDQCVVLSKLYSDPIHVARKVANLMHPTCMTLSSSGKYRKSYMQLSPSLEGKLSFFYRERDEYIANVRTMRQEAGSITGAYQYHTDITKRIKRVGMHVITFINQNLELIEGWNKT